MSANVDQRRVLKFSSLEAFNAVSRSLEYPGLFMIGDTNSSDIDGTPINRTARRAALDVISDAEFGDILMTQISTNKLLVIPVENYNLETYPFENYKPIAVCIYDKVSNQNNQAVFMSFQMSDTLHLGTGIKKGSEVSFGFNNFDISQVVPSIRSSSASSIYINNQMRNIVTKDYSGNTVTGSSKIGDADAFGVCWRFKTVGTEEGEWYLPSRNDIDKFKNNYSYITSIFSKVGGLVNTSDNNYMSSSIFNMTYAYEMDEQKAYYIKTTGQLSPAAKYSGAGFIYPVFIVE